MFDGYWRDAVERRVDPVGAAMHRAGLRANALTAGGVVAALGVAVAVAAGHLRTGFVLFLVAAAADLLDGPVAKAHGVTTVRGAFFDSTADRVSDTLVLGGITWHLVAEDRGLLAMVPVGVMAASWLISYQRAKAESLRLDAKGGIMERAERMVVLGVGLAVPPLLVPVLWLMLALTVVTAAQRFAKVWRQASVPPDRIGRADHPTR
ncbi:MAG: CDP-alcohol phosphatidyltransferase family protein [Acidimicrobiia bacterium]|nr:CDP-alcohol phosphatidyltransferase family protein [Acidimicrobiia bacterium]